MSAIKLSPAPERKVALCYIRLSFTREGDDTNSPERQRANIQAFCDSKGWLPEWYEDTGGHRSGRSEENRPEWLKLKKRLGDPDVVALVANDLSRLHRKGWRVGELLSMLDKYGVALAIAAPGRQDIDTSTQQGRLLVQLGAMFDEYYAEDISQRAKENIAHRKAQGKTVGMPPFGTIRNRDGYLIPSSDGAWYLTNGRFQAGSPDNPPEQGAKWRSYYECARYILEIFCEDNIGYEKIAYRLANEGWPVKDRKGKPRAANREDVRRVLSNWPEYGGMVMDRKAKSRPAYEEYDVDELPFVSERAVFPVKLLRTVAKLRKERSRRPVDHGAKKEVFAYPLSAITYCAHCEKLAIQHNDPSLHTPLSGTNMNGIRRYRHKSGVTCGCSNRSVPCDLLETDFIRLVRLLSIKPEAIELMTELAIEADRNGSLNSDLAFEAQRQQAIALCKRKIDAAVQLYGDGMIDRDEYMRRVENNQREIAHWEARTTDTQKLGIEFAMTIKALDELESAWESGNPENRQGMARNLFTYIVYDLDIQRITGFRLKPWADRFLVVRSALYENDGNKNAPSGQGLKRDMPHRGIEPLF